MIYRLLALSLCLRYAWACIPVRPGEDMPCPSTPKATTDPTKFIDKGLTAMNSGGTMIFGCNGDDILLELENGMYSPLQAGSTIECKPKSGLWTQDGMAVGSKTYVCGETVVPCPTLLKATDLGTGIDVVPDGPDGPTNNADGEVYTCPAPSRLWSQEVAMPMNNQEFSEGDTVICKKQSGVLTLVKGGMESPVTATATSFACGTRACQKCGDSMLLDPAASCTNQADLFCTSKPTKTDDLTTKCPILSCGLDTMYLLTSDIAFMQVTNPASVTCDNGAWKINNMAIPGTSLGFVCGKLAECTATCNGAVQMAYTGLDLDIGDLTMAPLKVKPTCTYSCGSDHTMFVGTVMHTAAVCNMMTEKVTADTEGGEALSSTNQFSCEKCDCEMNLDDGSTFCSFGRICAMPMKVNACNAKCEGNSLPLYLDASGTPKSSTSDSFQCLLPGGTSYIEEGSTSVTCQYPEGEGGLGTQPTSCPTLTPAPCGNNPCTFTNLVFIPTTGTGFSVKCSDGKLINENNPDEAVIIECLDSGQWSGTIAEQANCVTGGDPAPLCVVPNVNVITECKLGVCRTSCAEPGKTLSYLIGLQPPTRMNKYLNCENGDFFDVNDNGMADTIMCV